METGRDTMEIQRQLDGLIVDGWMVRQGPGARG